MRLMGKLAHCIDCNFKGTRMKCILHCRGYQHTWVDENYDKPNEVDG